MELRNSFCQDCSSYGENLDVLKLNIFKLKMGKNHARTFPPISAACMAWAWELSVRQPGHFRVKDTLQEEKLLPNS